MSTLTEQEKRNIALGYNWEPDWSYEYFAEQNLDISQNMSYDMFQIIEQRYIEYIYEKDNQN